MSSGKTNPDPDGYKPPLVKPSLEKQSTPDEAARFLQAEIAKLEAISKGLAEDKAALIQEYVLATDEEAPEKVKKNIRARMPRALEVIDEALQLGGTDAKAVATAKWVIDRGLAPDSLGGSSEADRGLKTLLDEIKSKDD